MKIAMIDIDGVLNYYPEILVKFCNDTLNTSFKSKKEIKRTLSYEAYEILKNKYRQSNYKHDAKIRENSVELINYLRKNDYLIYIITSRELFKFNQLEKTILWLQKNNIKYDYIYCSQKKDFTIFEKFGHCDLIVEDSCDNIEKIQKINGEAKYYNVLNSENEEININNCKRIHDLREIIYDLEQEKGKENV